MLGITSALEIPPDEAVYHLGDAISLHPLRERETLYRQDEPVTRMYLLQSGRLLQERRIHDSRGRQRLSVNREVEPGGLLAQYDLLYGDGYSTRVRALEPSTVIGIEAAAVDRLLSRFPGARNTIAPATVLNRLRTLPFLATLDQAALRILAELHEELNLQDGELIYSATHSAEEVFLIDRGQVKLAWPAGDVAWLGNGMELGVLHPETESTASAEAAEYGHNAFAVGETRLYRWPRLAFEELRGFDLEKTAARMQDARKETLDLNSVFAQFSDEERARLLGYMSHYYFPARHNVLQQGEVGDSMWIMLPGGTATMSALEGSRAQPATKVAGPNFFNELVLRVDHPSDSTVQADPGSQWLRLHKGDFQSFLHNTNRLLVHKLNLSPAAQRFLGRTKERRRYQWLHFGENLVVFRRRHWVFFIRKMFVPFVLLLLLILGSVLILQTDWETRWKVALIAPFAIFVSIVLLWNLVDYLNDYFVVTNQRVMRQEKVVFFREKRKAAFLEQVRNVDFKTTFFGRLLGYGLIVVQTAATQGVIEFNFVPDPNDLKQRILEQQSRRLQHYQASGKLAIQQMLEERLGTELSMPPRVSPGANGNGNGKTNAAGWHAVWNKIWLPSRRASEAPPERIVWRKHWLILLKKLSGPLLVMASMALLLFGEQLLPEWLDAVTIAIDSIIGVIFVVAFLWLLWEWADWRNDTYEIDFRQLADVEKKPLFFEEKRRTALLSEIENVDVSLASPINYLFNFGNVLIQTAATEGGFTFNWVPNPRGVGEEIWRRVEAYRALQQNESARQRAEELPDWFEMYHHIGALPKR